MGIDYIDLSMSEDEYEKEISPLLKRVFLKGNFVGGDEVEEFEKNFSKYIGSKYAISLNSGTDALILSLKALDISCGDEVITVSNSFISTANAIKWVGAEAVFVDIGNDLLIDTSKIKRAINKKTKAIIPVHLMGLACDMSEINKIAKEYGLKVIEDAAQSVGSLYEGQKTGTLGDIGAFSLHPLKNLGGIGDGGIVTTDNEDLANKIRMLRNNGLKSRDTLEVVGIVSRLDSINATVLDYRLKKVDKIIHERREKAKLYNTLLKSVLPIKEDTKRVHSYHTFVIICEKRDELKEFLKERTTIIIAHRLSTIRDADYIYVMEGGRIIEEGTYKELIKKDGLFLEFAKRS